MGTKLNFLTLLVYGLSCYRLALMLSEDSGPYAAFSKLRSFLKREAKQNKPLRDSKVHLGITCIRCDSVWVAIPIAAYAYFRRYFVEWFTAGCDIFLVAMALSALSIIISRAWPKKP